MPTSAPGWLTDASKSPRLTRSFESADKIPTSTTHPTY